MDLSTCAWSQGNAVLGKQNFFPIFISIYMINNNFYQLNINLLFKLIALKKNKKIIKIFEN